MSREEYSDVFFEGPAYALIIGISNYEHSPGLGKQPEPGQFTTLKFAAKDATDFADFLTHHGFIPENIKSLIDKEATLTNIKNGFNELATNCAQSGPNSLVIVYFSGHGIANTEKKHYLVPWEGRKDDLVGTCWWNKEFRSYLAELKTNRLVVFLDACDAGGYLEVEGARGEGVVVAEFDATRDLGEGTGRCIIASCKPGERSWEGEDNGIFTGHLLELLRGKTDDIKEEEIDIFNLYPPLKRKVMKTAWKMYEQTQEPTVSELKGTGIVLAINKRVREKKVQEVKAAHEKKNRFLAAICERIPRPDFVCDLKTVITEKLKSYVATGKQFDGYKEFYRLFDDYSTKRTPDDFSRLDECVQLLIDTHQRAFDAAPVSKESPSQEAKPVDKFDQAPENKVLGGDTSQTMSAPTTSDQQEARCQLSAEDRDRILAKIPPQASYFKVTFALRTMLNQPVSEADFIKKVLELGDLKVGEDLQAILEGIVERFQECWAKPKTNAPEKLSDFLMKKR